MNKTFISIAWRSIWRNRRRSLLTVSMISFGLFLSILMQTVMDGTQEELFKGAIELNLGSIQIHAKDYQENQTLNESFEVNNEIKTLLNNEPLVKAWTPRIISGGMVSVGENTNIATIVGIDPVKEAQVSVLKDKMMSPKILAKKYPLLYPQAPTLNPFLNPKPQMQIIIGDKLAEKLEAKIGDDLAVMSQGADGSTGSNMYQITGVYHTGALGFDNGFYMHIQEADELLSMYGQVSMVSVLLPKSSDVPVVLPQLKRALSDQIYEVMGWNEIAPELVDMMALKNASNHLFMIVLLIITGFGILNTVFMTIMERIKEFGVLKALGTTPQQIFSLVMYETLFITLVGVLIGNILGFGLSYYLKLYPIDISSMSELYEEMGISNLTQIPADPQAYVFIIFSSLVFALALLAAVYPAIKAARLEPLDALKHN